MGPCLGAEEEAEDVDLGSGSGMAQLEARSRSKVALTQAVSFGFFTFNLCLGEVNSFMVETHRPNHRTSAGNHFGNFLDLLSISQRVGNRLAFRHNC